MSIQAIAAVLNTFELGPTERVVLIALCNHANEKHQCFPSHKHLAQQAGVTDRTVLTTLKSLEDKGYISRQERRREDGGRTTDLVTLHIQGEGQFFRGRPRNEACSGGEESSLQESPKNPPEGSNPPTGADLFEGESGVIAFIPDWQDQSLVDATFEQAWLDYPKLGRLRSSKADSLKRWREIAKKRESLAELRAASPNYAASADAQEAGGKFVPAMERWLRRGLWEHWVDAKPSKLPAGTVSWM